MTKPLGQKVNPAILAECDAPLGEYDKACAAAWAEYSKACDAAWAEYDKARDAAWAECAAARDAAWAECAAALLETVQNDPVASWIVEHELPSNPVESLIVLGMLPTTMEELTAVAAVNGWCDWDLRVDRARAAGILDEDLIA